jgi:hypothetical protein
LILRFSNWRWTSLETSSSSPGASRGNASTTVTVAPNEAKTLANSSPTAPAPTTITDFGMASSDRAWSEVMKASPSMSMNGSERA